MTIAGSQRRAEYAEVTRLAIVSAARDLFEAHGFLGTKVDDIARAAQVAPKTVYAVTGGKQGLLSLFVDEWVRDPAIEQGLSGIPEFEDSREMLQALSAGAGIIFRAHGAVIRLAVEAAPFDEAAADKLREATLRIRSEMLRIVRNIRDRGELVEDLSDSQGVDVLFYFFGFKTLPILTRDFGWEGTLAENWLLDQACFALLRRA